MVKGWWWEEERGAGDGGSWQRDVMAVDSGGGAV